MINNMKPKVSFAVAVYNVSKFIEECVRSLFEQTMDDIEVIIVDDCTPDESIDIVNSVLEEYPNRKSQVRIIHHEQNLGIAATKNEGILSATGEYVIIIDGDDYVDRRMAELMYAKAIEVDADMVIADFYRVYEKGMTRDTLVPDGVKGDGENVRMDFINRRVPPFHVVKLIRRSLYDINGVVWPEASLGEDTVYDVVTVYYSRSIAHVAEPLYFYRYNTSSISNGIKSEEKCMRNYNDFKRNFTVAWDFLKREGVSEKYKRGAVINKIRTKNRLLDVTNKWKYRKLWWSTYSEINKVILFGNDCYKTSYKEWVWVVFIMLGLYPRFRKRLRSRRFLPSVEWI